MQHRLLLGSTALVSAGMLLAGASPARADIEVVLGGFTEFGVAAGSDNTITNNDDRKYTFYMDNEVFFLANGATEGGILYGSKVELEVGSGGIGGGQSTGIDEAGLFFSGNFGRVELGRDDGAEDVMYVGGEDAQAGTGGIDGDIPNINFVQFLDTSDAAKVTYFTPRVAGFQLGASWTPDYEDNGGEDQWQGGSEGENGVGAGANWVGALGAVDLTVAGVLIMADCESDCNTAGVASTFDDDQFSWAVGALLGFGGLTLGAGYNRADDFAPAAQDLDIINVGLKYGLGAANVSVGYTYNNFDGGGLDDSHLFTVSGDIGLMPGVTLKGDVGYNTDDLGAVEGGVNEQDDTIGGVLSVQLDY